MRIILPICDNVGKPLDDIHRRLRKTLAIEFGGAFGIPAFGVWLNPRTGEVVEEECIAYTPAAHLAEWVVHESKVSADF